MIKYSNIIYLGKAQPEGGSGGGSATIEALSITPSTTQQTISATSSVDGYAPINVSAVTSSIDANITSANIVSGVTILGVNGSATKLNGTTLNVIPTTSAQTLTPISPYNGYTSVSVSAVTNNIDANIQAENIKKDVVILGVTGNYEGTSPSGRYSIRANGIYNIAQYSSVDVQVADSILGLPTSAFVNVSGTSIMQDFDHHDIDGSTILTVYNYGLKYRFAGMNIKSADFGSVTSAGDNSFEGAFAGINAGSFAGTFDFSTISKPGYGAFIRLFYDAKLNSSTQIKFTNLKDLSDNLASYCFYEAFARNENNINTEDSFPTSISFPALENVNIGDSFVRAFAYRDGLTSVSFPALLTSGVSQFYNIFTNMLIGVTGCTVHFPAALQSVIGSWTDVTNGFGGTNTTVLFDL